MSGNPVYSLFVEALETADRLPLDPRASLADAIGRAGAIIELPGWLPQFEDLIARMADARRAPTPRKRRT